MNDLNSVLIEGNLTRDPELTYTPKGTPLCKLSIAANRYYKSEDELQNEVSYFDIECWGRQAENCGEYLNKGRGVRIVGRLKQERWESTGATRSRIVVVAEHVEFKPAKKSPAEETANVQ